MTQTITGPALKFDIVADRSGFGREVQAAQADWKSASQAMSGDGADLGSSLSAVMSGAMDAFQAAGESLGRAFAGGANAAEDETVKAFNAVREQAGAFITGGLASFGDKWLGRFGRQLGEVLGGQAQSALDSISTRLVGKLSDTLGSNEWVQQFSADMEKVRSEFAASEGAASEFAKKLGDMVEGVKNAALVIQGLAMSGSVFDGMLGALDTMTERFQLQREEVGKTAAQLARLRAERQAMKVEGFDQMSDPQKERYNEKLGEVSEAAQAAENAKQAHNQAKAFESITTQIDRQLELTEAKRQEEGLTAGQIAEERLIRDAITKMQARGRELSEAELDIIQDQGRSLRIITDENTRAALIKQAERNADRAYQREFDSRREIGATPGKLAELRYYNAELQRARDQNINLTDAEKARYAQNARNVGTLAQNTAAMREQMQLIQQAGQMVARGIEDAFGKLMTGTQIKWREWVHGLMADLAKLMLRTQILQPLFGGGTSGGGLLGNMLFGQIAGARAAGGPVTSGSTYLVGERGPELFVPNSAGQIVPNGAMGGSGPTTINMRIDLAGANGDATIARIAAQAAAMAARRAVQETSDAFPMRSRQLQLLGT